MFRWFIALGGIGAFLGVALGAFGAHGLEERLSRQMLETWETAVHYHLVHALGLILVGICRPLGANRRWVAVAGWLLAAGIALFSGSLYLLVVTGERSWGAVTPFGGLALLAGWTALVIAVLRTSE